MSGHDRQHIFGNRVVWANNFDLGSGNPSLAEFLKRLSNGAVGRERPFTVKEVRCHIQKPVSVFVRSDPEGGLHRVAVGGEPFDESAAIIKLVGYQRALIHGSTPFSIASYRAVASFSVLPIS